MYPFGNAQEIKLKNGTYSFHCQHGFQECQAMLFEVCLMKSLKFRARKYLPILTCKFFLFKSKKKVYCFLLNELLQQIGIENKIGNGEKIEESVKSCIVFSQSMKTYKWIKECAEASTYLDISI